MGKFWYGGGAHGRYLLLDDGQNHAPIWRIQADGTSAIEIVVYEGYLLDGLNNRIIMLILSI